MARLAVWLLVPGALTRALPVVALPPALVPPPLAAPEPGGRDLELTVGVRAERSAVHAETAGFVALAVPLERLAAPRRAVASADASPHAETTPDVAATGESPTATARAEPAPPPAVALLHAPALSRLARGAVAAALLRERTAEREGALSSMASRSRWSALLPEVRVRTARTRDEALRLQPTTEDPYRFTRDGGDAMVFEGAATFRLARLVFADDELAVERLRLERERAAERLTARVLERLFAWHLATSRLAEADDDQRLRLDLERLAAEVELDVLTGGWFGARLAELGLGAGAPLRSDAPPRALDPGRLSARSASPCLPKHETGSPTSCGALTR